MTRTKYLELVPNLVILRQCTFAENFECILAMLGEKKDAHSFVAANLFSPQQ